MRDPTGIDESWHTFSADIVVDLAAPTHMHVSHGAPINES